jgi:hypothetical protein
LQAALLYARSSALASRLGRPPPKRKLIAATFDQIAGKAKLGDVFVLYLSGHGKSVAGRYYFYPQTLDFSKGRRVEEHGIGQDAWQAPAGAAHSKMDLHQQVCFLRTSR